jgi:hypothetical protein
MSDLIQKPKGLDMESNEANQCLGDDFFNSTMVKSKSSWSSIVNSDTEKPLDAMSVKSDNQMFSPYFDSSNFDSGKNDQSPTLAALLNGNKNGPGNYS